MPTDRIMPEKLIDPSVNTYIQNNVDETELSLKDIYYILRRNITIVSLTTFIVLFFTVVNTLMTIPVYESTAMIMVEEPNQSMAIFDMGFDNEMNLLSNEIEILKSRTLAESTVDYLWNSEHRNNLFVFGTKVYQPKGIRKLLRQIITFGIWEQDTAKILFDSIPDDIKMATVGRVRGSMSVGNQRGTNVLEITFTNADPDEAALLANTIVDLYTQRDQAWTTGEIINLKVFLEKQLINTEQDLAQVEDSLRSFQEREQIYEVSGSARLLLQQLTDIEGRYYSIIAQQNIIREKQSYVDKQLTKEEKTLAERLLNSMNSRLLALRLEIAQNEADRVKNISQYGENHEIIKPIEDKIGRLKANLQQQTDKLIAQGISTADPIRYRQALMDTVLNLEAVAAGYNARAIEYKKLVEKYNNLLNKLPWKTLQLARLERDKSVLSQTYSLLRQKLEEAKVSQASQLGKVRTIDPAIPPTSRIKPITKTNMLLGLMVGLGLGVGVAFLMEYIDNTIKSVETVERKGLTILGIIPAMGDGQYDKKKYKRKAEDKGQGTNSNKRSEAEHLQRRLITHEDPKSPVAEAYRSLRTSLMYSSAGNQIKSILVSSPGPGEGKTTTVANLAITYANLGKKTLLLDTDLRRPVLHRVLNVSRDPGITNYLSGNIENFNDLVQDTEIDNLYIVSSGVLPPNPSELLGSKRMLNLVAKLEKEWDMILFDSPPLVAVTDATMISKEIDRIVMVVKSGSTDKGAFNRTLLALQNVEAPLSGIVMNAVTSKNSYGSYYYYYQYYHYYSDSSKQ